MSTKKTFVFSRTKGGDPYVVPPVDMFHINIDNNGQLEVIDHKSNVINQFFGSKTFTGQAEINFGELPVYSKEFTIENSDITIDSKITASLAYEAPSGKDLDEVTMDDLNIICGVAALGSFKMFVKAVDGSYLHDKFKINYSFSV